MSYVYSSFCFNARMISGGLNKSNSSEQFIRVIIIIIIIIIITTY